MDEDITASELASKTAAWLEELDSIATAKPNPDEPQVIDVRTQGGKQFIYVIEAVEDDTEDEA